MELQRESATREMGNGSHTNDQRSNKETRSTNRRTQLNSIGFDWRLKAEPVADDKARYQKERQEYTAKMAATSPSKTRSANQGNEQSNSEEADEEKVENIETIEIMSDSEEEAENIEEFNGEVSVSFLEGFKLKPEKVMAYSESLVIDSKKKILAYGQFTRNHKTHSLQE